jgi:hypothetical protein
MFFLIPEDLILRFMIIKKYNKIVKFLVVVIYKITNNTLGNFCVLWCLVHLFWSCNYKYLNHDEEKVQEVASVF